MVFAGSARAVQPEPHWHEAFCGTAALMLPAEFFITPERAGDGSWRATDYACDLAPGAGFVDDDFRLIRFC